MIKSLFCVVIMAAVCYAVYAVFIFDSPIVWSSSPHSSDLSQQKCIAGDGKVYYGLVPSDVTCIEQQAVEGNLSILPFASGHKVAEFPAAKRSNPSKCDGRRHCSQMSSCREARFFLNNCPSVKMDGDGDGIPCEKQWC